MFTSVSYQGVSSPPGTASEVELGQQPGSQSQCVLNVLRLVVGLPLFVPYCHLLTCQLNLKYLVLGNVEIDFICSVASKIMFLDIPSTSHNPLRSQQCSFPQIVSYF